MRRLAQLVIEARVWVLAGAAIFVAVAAAFGLGVHDRLTVGGFDDPGSESNQAARRLKDGFSAGQPNFAVVVTTNRGTVDDRDAVRAGTAITARLGDEDGVSGAISYWSLGRPAPLRNDSGNQALILANIGSTRAEAVEAVKRLSPEYSGEQQGVRLQVTGEAEVARQAIEQSEKDLQRAELISTPLTMIALVLVFGGLVAAGLPLLVGIVAVLGTFFVLTLITGFTDVSVFALNLTTALGLGLGIDYSLFIVSRYREELARGYPPSTALSHTMQTAGRTVVFSAGTVALSLAALLVFPMVYLRSFAYAGMAVVALAALTAVVVLPALLAVLGPRVDAGRVLRRQPMTEHGFWYRQAHRVMKHPWRYITVVTALLLLLAVPFLSLRTGLIDDRVLPASASSRQATEDVRHNFASREAGALSVFVPGGAAQPEQLNALASELAGLDGVARVDALTGYYLGDDRIPPDDLSSRFGNDTDDTWLSVVPDVEPISGQGEDLVDRVRETVRPADGVVGGPSAALVDTKAAIGSRLPLAVGFVAVATFVLLFFLTGSLLVPLKALLLNLLSLTATFGAMVWVFQQGHLAGLLGVTTTGSIDVFTPLLMFCVAFGLSMDYEVFLISRIKEEYDLDRDNEESVAMGLQRTGRIVTAAAVLLSIVFVAIATAEVAIVKLFGVGLALAVLVDAFLIRATLVPAFMRLAGRANWWAPKPLRRFHLRFGVWENEPIDILDRRDGYGTAAARRRGHNGDKADVGGGKS
ncbi:MMPL family transporter [soil metagenome]